MYLGGRGELGHARHGTERHARVLVLVLYSQDRIDFTFAYVLTYPHPGTNRSAIAPSLTSIERPNPDGRFRQPDSFELLALQDADQQVFSIAADSMHNYILAISAVILSRCGFVVLGK